MVYPAANMYQVLGPIWSGSVSLALIWRAFVILIVMKGMLRVAKTNWNGRTVRMGQANWMSIVSASMVMLIIWIKAREVASYGNSLLHIHWNMPLVRVRLPIGQSCWVRQMTIKN